MAKAETTKEVTRVTLLLSADEADAVAAVLASVAGSPVYSPRKHTRAVLAALTSAGFGISESKSLALLSGKVTFQDFKEAN